jgi:hypothetical protein
MDKKNGSEAAPTTNATVYFFDAALATEVVPPTNVKTDAARVEATATPWTSRIECDFI